MSEIPSSALRLVHRIAGCALCDEVGGVPVWSDDEWRVIRVEDAAFPAFYRLISNAHVGEFSDLASDARQRCIDKVCAIERVLIDRLRPTKMNLASLGNVVPHLHWHVIARFDWDSRFPQPVWAPPQREVSLLPTDRLGMSLAVLDAAVAAALGALGSEH